VEEAVIAALWSAFVGVCIIVAMTFVVWTAISAVHSWRYERGRKQLWEARRARNAETWSGVPAPAQSRRIH
jgi:hypothetical protein